MAAYDDWWASPDDWLYPRRPPGMLPPQDQLWRAAGPAPTMPNWGQLQDPGVFTAPRRPPAGDVVLPSGQASFGDTTPPPQDDSTFRLATAALAPYATGNARLGGASSVEGVGEDLSNRFLKMAAGMPEPLRARLAIESGYRDRARQMQVNPSAPNSRHGAGTGPPGTGAALDLAKDPEVLQWIRENGPQYGVGFPLYPKDPREINHLEAVSGGGARLPAGASPPSQGQGQGQQGMAGISDIFSLFGGGGQAPTPGLLDQVGYMDPKEYDARRNSASMMGLYAGLLQGGGPSLTPRNFGSALGAGLIGQNQFGTQFDEAQQHRATAQAKLAEIDFRKQGAALTAEWIRQGEGGGVKTPADTAGTPAAKAPDFGEAYKGEGDPASLTKHFESGGNYNIGYGGTDLSKAPRDEFGFPIWEGKDNSHAAGAYQFQPGTWARYAGPLGIKDFSPESQDKVFAAAFAAEGWKPWVPYNPRLAAEVARRTGQGAGERTAAAGAPVLDFTEGRSAQLGNAVAPDILNRERVLAARAPAPGPLAAPAVLAGPEAAPAPAPRVLTQQAQYAADVAAGRRPILPPGTKFNSRGEAISPDLTATLPGQQSGANYPPGMRFPAGGPPATSGSTIRPIAATDEPSADAGGDGPQYGSGVLRGPAPPPTGPAPVPQAIAPAPPVPPAAAPSGAAASVAMPPTTPGAAPVAGGPVTVKLPAAPTLPVPTIAPAQPLPAAPETPAVPARPVIPGGVAPAVSPQVAAQARRAQGVVLGLTMMGVHVPDFLQKEAGIAIAGRTAAAEAEARQPIELQTKMFEASLTAAQKRWDALNDQQKETLAAQRGATKDQMQAMYANIHEQFKTILDLSSAGPKAQSIAEGQLPSDITKIERKEEAQANNTQTTMVIGGREVPMTVGQANRISNGERPEAVLGRGVLELGKQYLTPEQQSRAQAGATKSVDYSFKRLEDAATAGDAAGRNLQTMGQLAQAAERFKTGATAEVWLDVKRYARDAGLITGADVPDGELIRQGATKLAVMNAPRQGAISNYERGLMSTINPQLVNSPEAFSQLVAISARLDQYDMQVSQIHHDVAQNNGGVPDYLEANRRIRELGPPISPQERAALERLQTNDAARAAAPPAATTAAQYRWDPAANGGQGAVVPNTGR